MTLRDWRPKQFEVGEDPDPRFTLANERTFLAWARTALGLVAAAVGLEAFGTDVVGPVVRTVLVLGLLVGAAVVGIFAFTRWLSVEGALRTGRSLPVPAISWLLVGLVVGAALVLGVVVVVR